MSYVPALNLVWKKHPLNPGVIEVFRSEEGREPQYAGALSLATLPPSPRHAALVACAEAAKRRMEASHNDNCDAVLWCGWTCSCGHEDLRAALAALDETEGE